MIEKCFTKGWTSSLPFLNKSATAGGGGEVNNDIIGLTYTAVEKRIFGSDRTHTGDAFFIPWASNGINYVQTMGRDVISGPFTGCIMASYDTGGGRRVCHVATPECNAAWTTLKAQAGVTLNVEFQPHLSVNVGSLKKKLTGGLYCMGVITATDDCYAIILSNLGSDNFQVTQVVKVH